uniref:Uncharacterized protein n=1 Tax=Mycena chlorophos TaxID=658473 RepID=A0ABQ0L1G0_MYCCL|nr:predicted protein [Mycena chlorophos]
MARPRGFPCCLWHTGRLPIVLHEQPRITTHNHPALYGSTMMTHAHSAPPLLGSMERTSAFVFGTTSSTSRPTYECSSWTQRTIHAPDYPSSYPRTTSSTSAQPQRFALPPSRHIDRFPAHAKVIPSLGRSPRLPFRPARRSSRYPSQVGRHLLMLGTAMGLGGPPVVDDACRWFRTGSAHLSSITLGLACARTCMVYRIRRRMSSFGGRSGKRLVDDLCIRRQGLRQVPASFHPSSVGCMQLEVPAQLGTTTDFLIVVAYPPGGYVGYVVVLRPWLATGNGHFETVSATTHSSRPKNRLSHTLHLSSSRPHVGPSSASSSIGGAEPGRGVLIRRRPVLPFRARHTLAVVTLAHGFCDGHTYATRG